MTRIPQGMVLSSCDFSQGVEEKVSSKDAVSVSYQDYQEAG